MKLRARVSRLLRRPESARDLEEEIQAHLALEAQERIDRGEAPGAAVAAARRAFGNAASIAESTREQWGWAALERFVTDVGYGWRTLKKTPGFTAIAVLTLAAGVGASTAIFSVVDSVLLRPLPYRDPTRLVTLGTTSASDNMPRIFVGLADYLDWRAQNTVFEDIAVTRPIANFNLTGTGTPERLNGARISEQLLPVLGVGPLLGRNITEQERRTGAAVALLSHGLWVRRFGSDPAILNRVIRLNGSPYQVIGVMPPQFQYPGAAHEIWVPLFFPPDEVRSRIGYNYLAVARLRPGVTVQQASVQMETIARRIAKRHAAIPLGRGVSTQPMLETTVGTVRRPLVVLLIGVGALLAIGCANLAGLLLARATGRLREISLRAALGATRARIRAQLVSEVLPIAAVGGVLGIVIARLMLHWLVPLLPPDMPRAEAIHMHLAALLLGIAASLMTVLAAALVPALNISRALTFSKPRSRVRHALVVAQIGITLALVVVCGLMLRSLHRVNQVNPGFSSERVLTMHLAVPRTRYAKDPEVAAYCARLMEAVKTLPGAEAVGMVNRLPLSGVPQTGPLEFEGAQAELDDLGNADWRSVTPDYFRTMGIPLLRGRGFTEADTETAKPVGIIDEQVARRLYPGRDPVGRRFRINLGGFIGPWTEIVGVAGHIRNDGIEFDLRPQVYWSYRQRTQDRMAVVVRTGADPVSLISAVIARIRSVDPEQPVYDVRTMEQWRNRTLRQRHLTTGLMAAFGLASLLLAILGVYGVVSYAAGMRTREFGIRVALGATRRSIRWLVFRGAFRLGLAGIAAGAAVAVPAAALIRSLLFGVSVTDTVVIAAAPAVLLAAALGAAFLPARRAVRVQPADALRHE